MSFTSQMALDFKVPSTVPQDLLLIQDLIGTPPPIPVVEKHVPGSLDSGDDSIASTDSEVESEDEVEAGLAPYDDDSGVSAPTSDSASPSDPELDANFSSDSEEGCDHVASQRQKSPDDAEDESCMPTVTTYLQTKNEIVDANIIAPNISEVAPTDVLEKVGEIMSIVEDTAIIRGLPVDHKNSLSERALDAESLLVFEDRKVLGYIYETFGPTSQPLYQVKFNQHYPLDTDKVRVSREVFHVPQRSYFVFVDRLQNLRGSDASNIHDEEPAEDEIEFSDDEKEAAFKAQRKKRRGRSVSSSRQSTPALPRIHIDDAFQGTHCSTNPYDAHGPYDDDYHVTRSTRPPPVPYDDPYADVPSSDVHARPTEVDGEFGEECERGGDVLRTSRGHVSDRSVRGRRVRNHRFRGTSSRGHHYRPMASQQTFDSDMVRSFPVASRMAERGTRYGVIGDAITSPLLVQPVSNAWLSPETNSTQGYGQSIIQPHINPRFASVFGLNLPSGSMVPWASQNTNAADDAFFPPHPWVDPWTMHGSAGSEGEGDTYRPM